jgi:hypothetical protein
MKFYRELLEFPLLILSEYEKINLLIEKMEEKTNFNLRPSCENILEEMKLCPIKNKFLPINDLKN